MWLSPWQALTRETVIAVLAVSFATAVMTSTHDKMSKNTGNPEAVAPRSEMKAKMNVI